MVFRGFPMVFPWFSLTANVLQQRPAVLRSSTRPASRRSSDARRPVLSQEEVGMYQVPPGKLT